MIFTRKKLVLRQDNNIRDALRLLNGDYGNIIVVLKNKKILGILTEGDLRRKLLLGYSLKDKIKDILKKNFFYLDKEQIKNTKKIIEKIQINNFDLFFSFPLINKNKELIKVIQIDKSILSSNLQVNLIHSKEKYSKNLLF